MNPTNRPRVLVLSRNYPNSSFPVQGLWVRRFVEAALPIARPWVVAPVPYAPPGLGGAIGRFRRIPRVSDDSLVPTHHPRFPAGPGYLLHNLEAALAGPFVRRLVDRAHREEPFALIHAHFIFPEGVIAARLGRRYGIPVVTTEHATWLPWLERFPRVRAQVLGALDHVNLVTAVSRSAAATVMAVAGDRVPVDVLPNVLDDEVFGTETPPPVRDRHRLLFVGHVRRVKGLDVLVRALAHLAESHPSLELTVIGEPYQRAYRRDEDQVRQLAGRLGIARRITFAGYASPAEVAAAMRRAAVVVVPSRRESFSSVAVEALASGTPVVATRCGGPEDIVRPGLGRLVAPEDPEALARAIAETLAHPEAFDGAAARADVVERFGRAAATVRLDALYRRVLAEGPPQR